MKIKRVSIAPPRIEMLPLIDIVFLLLVFFIYAMLSMAVHHGLPVDLPTSGSSTADTKGAVSITIQFIESGIVLFIDEEQVSLEELTGELTKRTSGTEELTETDVQIFADKTISYQQLFTVLDRVQKSGLTKISLQTRREEKSH